MLEIIFLWGLALIWIIFATVQDLKSREIANWLNFSLIIFALGFRFFYLLFAEIGFNFFYQGLIGFGIFFLLGNLLYYGRMFAGGDAKLMMALGAVLPIYETLIENARIFLIFFFSGAIYSLTVSTILAVRNFSKFKKEFLFQFKKHKTLLYLLMAFGLVIMFFGIWQVFALVFGIMFFVLPYFYISAKAIDESCMVKEIPVRKLREGDWLYKNLKIGKKIIKANWEGIGVKDIKLIQGKFKKVKVKQGVPFSPVFLISFVVLSLLILFNINLWNALW